MSEITKFSILNSPYSLLSVLLPFLYGLSNETQTELAKILNININKLDETFDKFAKHYKKLSSSGAVKINSLMLSNIDFKLKGDYGKKTSTFVLHGKITEDTETLIKKINKLVHANTNGMICNFLKSGELSADTLFVLLNTIYFYCDWQIKFDRTLTSKSTFYGLTNIREEHLMMLRRKRFKYIEENGNKYVVLPYTNSEYAFCAVLPRLKEGTPINTSILDITSEHVITALNAPHEIVNVWIPRFKKEMELDLIPFFKKCGIKSIFNGTNDIDNMSNYKGSLSVSLLKQKVKIIVEENGVEASAATIISGRRTGARRKTAPPKIYNFLANHPFTYYIVHVPSGMILFSGIYM